jgi:ParB family chromosome partitioning protein
VLIDVDPRDLHENPLNPREDLGDLSAEAASMREIGVLQPLIVVPAADDAGGQQRYMVLFGHRRRAAAIEAGLATVPCDVRPEYAGLSPEQLADMLAENLHRRDLTGVEEAGGYAQLAMFDGWTPERIARRIGRPVDHVRAGLAAAKVSPQLRPKVAGGALTLEQAAAIEEFAADPKAYARLLRAADYPPGLHHALADERHKVKVADRKEAARAALRDANVRIIAKPKNFPWSSVEARVTDLADPDGTSLTPEVHGSCPGNAAFIDDHGEAVYVCAHPKDWGHGTPPGYQHRSQAEAQEAAEAATALREFQQALAVADDARSSFLTEYLGRKGKAPAGTLRSALDLLARVEDSFGVSVDRAAQLLQPSTGPDGRPDDDTARAALTEAVAKAAENRLPYLALAFAAAAGEDNLRSRGASWRFDAALALHWLSVVGCLGYPLSEAEAQLRGDCQRQLDELTAAEAGDADAEEDGPLVEELIAETTGDESEIE